MKLQADPAGETFTATKGISMNKVFSISKTSVFAGSIFALLAACTGPKASSTPNVWSAPAGKPASPSTCPANGSPSVTPGSSSTNDAATAPCREPNSSAEPTNPGDDTNSQNTQKPNYLSDDEYAVAVELNKVRTNPAEYVETIKREAPEMRLYYSRVADDFDKGLNEIVALLPRTKVMRPFRLSPGLSHACRDHIEDSNTNGIVGHYGSDKSSPTDRDNRYGTIAFDETDQMKSGENIAYGSNTPVHVVVAWLIDAGVESRGHRNSILDADFAVLGVAIGPHPSMRSSCVVDFSAEYIEKPK